MASERIPLDEEEVRDFSTLASHGDRISELLAKSMELGPRVGTAAMSRLLAARLDAAPSEVHGVINGLLLLRAMQLGLELPANVLCDKIANSLSERVPDDVVEAWNAARSKIVQAVDALVEDHPLVVSQQAGNAAMGRSHVATSMEMHTDTRPVFNESKDRLLFSIISHVLVIEYHKGFRRHAEVHLSLDDADLDRLCYLCEQAKIAANALKAASSVPVAAPYESEDDE